MESDKVVDEKNSKETNPTVPSSDTKAAPQTGESQSAPASVDVQSLLAQIKAMQEESVKPIKEEVDSLKKENAALKQKVDYYGQPKGTPAPQQDTRPLEDRIAEQILKLYKQHAEMRLPEE